jgi:hypothetical protein
MNDKLFEFIFYIGYNTLFYPKDTHVSIKKFVTYSVLGSKMQFMME